MTGPAIGRPKSATFRTLDITGLDVLIHVARNLESRVGPEQARAFAPPALALAVAERGWIGEKAGQGFYRREKGPGGQSAILTLDPATMTYRAAAEGALRLDRSGARRSRTPAPACARCSSATIRSAISCAARSAPRCSTRRRSRPTSRTASTTSIARCAGATAGSSGRSRSPTRSACARWSTPVRRRPACTSGCRRWSPTGSPPAPTRSARAGACRPRPACCCFADAKARTPVVAGNPGASLVDLGDGVLGLELHSKMNALGGDAIAMLLKGVATAEAQFAALVVVDGRRQLLRRRQPDAAPARGAGRQLGRDRPDGAQLPARDDGAAPGEGAGRGRAGRARARRRLRDRAARRSRAGGGGNLPGPRRGRRRPDSRRRRHQGDAGARHRPSDAGPEHRPRRPGAHRVRDHRLREDLDVGRRGADAGPAASGRSREHEPRPRPRRRQGAGAGPRRRGLRGAGAARRRSRSAARRSRRS